MIRLSGRRPWYALCVIGFAAVAAAPAILAQSPEALPASLSGRWVFVGAGGRTVIDTWSAKFEADGSSGAVKGLVDWRGRSCGALAEPLKGTWNGTELRFGFTARPNVNTQIMGATMCGEGKTDVVLRRKPGTRDFEGSASFNDGQQEIQVSGTF